MVLAYQPTKTMKPNQTKPSNYLAKLIIKKIQTLSIDIDFNEISSIVFRSEKKSKQQWSYFMRCSGENSNHFKEVTFDDTFKGDNHILSIVSKTNKMFV